MARKNRNARNRSYTSFESLKNSTVQFDLSKGSFIRKEGRAQTATDDVEVRATFNGEKTDNLSMNFSLREDIAETLMKGYGKSWICGIVKEGVFERLYFIPDADNGYAMYRNQKNSKRFYARFPIADKAAFEKYIGNHDMMFDEYNKAYYIVVGE